MLFRSVLTPLFMNQRIIDSAFLAQNSSALIKSQTLNAVMQPFFRAWSKHSQKRNPARIIDQHKVEWFGALNEAIGAPMDTDALGAYLTTSADLLARLATAIGQHAKVGAPTLDSTTLQNFMAKFEVSDAPPGEDLLREFR